MNRPSGVAVAAVVTFSGATLLALTSVAFFVVAVLAATGDERGDPVSVAMAGMAIGGAFSLLILAVAAGFAAMNAVEIRDWARSLPVPEMAANIEARLRGVWLAVRHSHAVEVVSGMVSGVDFWHRGHKGHNSRRLEHHPWR